MRKKSWVMMKVLLNRFHHGSTDALQHCLPLEDVQIVLGTDVSSQDVKPAIIRPEEYFKQIHYSWLQSTIQKFSADLQPYIVSALEKPQAAGLANLLGLPRLPQPKIGAMRAFLLHELYEKFDSEEVLPPEYIPQTLLSVLLEKNKSELIEIIDFLGLYDLAEKIRQIVDKNRLKGLYQCITPSMQQFLSVCLHQKDKITAPELSLEKWKGDKESLLYILQQRGLLRLGKALAGTNSDFQWYLVHKLDIGRGKILMKYSAREEVPRITHLLTQQVLNIVNFMNKKSAS